MLAEFSIVPVGLGESLGKRIALLVEIVGNSGLPYKVNPMGTVVEGDWGEVMNVIRSCHEKMLEEAPRVVTTIKIDDRPGRKGMITGKISSIEKHLGRNVEK